MDASTWGTLGQTHPNFLTNQTRSKLGLDVSKEHLRGCGGVSPKEEDGAAGQAAVVTAFKRLSFQCVEERVIFCMGPAEHRP